jgi:hypothetical protein
MPYQVLPVNMNRQLEFAASEVKVGAGEGNRTLVISLEGCCSTIELHPRQGTVISSQSSETTARSLMTDY